jgi:transposase
MERRKRRSFTPEYKAEVVGLVRTSGKSIGQVARELGLTETAVRGWVKRAAIDDKRDPSGPLTSQERAELTRLRRELKTVSMERDFLRNDLAPAGAPCGRETLSAVASRRSRGAAVSLLVHTSPSRNMVRGWQRTCDW